MDPAVFKEWIANFRDIATAAIGIYMLYHESQLAIPNYLIIGAGLSLVGVPAVLKVDGIRRKGSNGSSESK
jgi:hypothetical protein